MKCIVTPLGMPSKGTMGLGERGEEQERILGYMVELINNELEIGGKKGKEE